MQGCASTEEAPIISVTLTLCFEVMLCTSRCRWTSDGASIFSVDDGKRLAQTPVKEPTAFERIRADRIARQQLETPLVRGMRLLPVFTPGRCTPPRLSRRCSVSRQLLVLFILRRSASDACGDSLSSLQPQRGAVCGVLTRGVQ